MFWFHGKSGFIRILKSSSKATLRLYLTIFRYRYGKIGSWVCSPCEFSDDQLSESTAHEEAPAKDRRLKDSDAREQLRRALPQAPPSSMTGYDNTSQALMSDSSPYEEISEVLGNSRTNVDLQSEPGSDRRFRAKVTEGIVYDFVVCSVDGTLKT